MSAIWCTSLELSGELPEVLTPPQPRYTAARVLVRLHGSPLGLIEIPLRQGGLAVFDVLTAARTQLREAINDHLVLDGGRPVSVAASPSSLRTALAGAERRCGSGYLLGEPVTVVVCTRNRPQLLATCLQHLKRLSYPRLEVLVVDNAPSDDATRQAFDTVAGDDARFRYLREPRPGLSCARNRGLAEATGTIVAYTDDDVETDPDWVRALVAPFADPAVACTTGLVCTAAIDGPAERYFDARVSWASSWQPVVHRIGGPTDDGLFPYATGSYGTGASFAVRASAFRALGGFDEALGAGTRTAGGEDIDAFVRVILAGYSLAYQPSALVWHRHRSDLPSLRRQLFAYGTGTSAFILKQLLRPATRREVLRRVPKGVRKVLGTARDTQAALAPSPAPSPAPAQPAAVPSTAAGVPARALLVRELAGLAAGPVLYLRARRAIPPGAPSFTRPGGQESEGTPAPATTP